MTIQYNEREKQWRVGGGRRSGYYDTFAAAEKQVMENFGVCSIPKQNADMPLCFDSDNHCCGQVR
jgi:hypothetical protein